MTCNTRQRAPEPETARNYGLLRAQGRRITSQRALILALLADSPGHIDAAVLYRRARRRDPRINLATVYRTLKLLEDSGLVEPSYLAHGDRRRRFEARPASEHYHFLCSRCGQVIEFESPFVARLERQVERERGVRLEHAHVLLEGLCAECAAKED